MEDGPRKYTTRVGMMALRGALPPTLGRGNCITTETRRHGDTENRVASDWLCGQVIGAAIEVHRALGPGLLESLYSKCLGIELELRNIPFEREVAIPVRYRGVTPTPAYRVDLIVNHELIVEVKSAARLEAVHQAQLLTYLRLAKLRVGFLLNFNNEVLKHGIRRVSL